MIELHLTLDIYDGTGYQRLVRGIYTEWVPSQGGIFLLEDGLRCTVKDVVGRIDGTVDILLRLKEAVGDPNLICQHLVGQGWQRGLPPESTPMRRNI